MDRKILEFLYEKYEGGNFSGYHDMADFLRTEYKGGDFKKYLSEAKDSLYYLARNELIEFEISHFLNWGKDKAPGGTGIISDYNNDTTTARITTQGIVKIDKLITATREKVIDDSILRTNKLTRWNIGVTIALGIIIAWVQIATFVRDGKGQKPELEKEKASQQIQRIEAAPIDTSVHTKRR